MRIIMRIMIEDNLVKVIRRRIVLQRVLIVWNERIA